jgi:exodeoxyribonuclease V alpha subunit
VHDAWQAGLAMARLVRLVEGSGWPMDAVRSAHARFGADVVDVAREDPYLLLLAERVRFAHVDRLAERLGVPRDDPRRLTAGAVPPCVPHDGRTATSICRDARRTAAAVTLLGVDAMLAVDGLDRAVARGRLVAETLGDVDVVALPSARDDEVALATGLIRLLRRARPVPGLCPVTPRTPRTDAEVDDVGVVLTADQRAAVDVVADAA